MNATPTVPTVRRWIDYLHREVYEVEGNTLRLISEDDVQEWAMSGYAINKTAADLDRHYRTTLKRGRKPRWLESALNRGHFASGRPYPGEVIVVE